MMSHYIVGMIRTQIQLPDELYKKARELAREHEISLAELARRGLEYVLSVYAAPKPARRKWTLPESEKLGWKNLSHAKVRQILLDDAEGVKD